MTIQTYNVQEAKENLPRLLEKVASGAEVIIAFLRQLLEPEALKPAPVLVRSLKMSEMWCHKAV